MKRVGVVDCGIGNLRSVCNAFLAIGAEPELVRDPASLAAVDRIVLPGVGAFGDGIAALRAAGFPEVLREQVLGRGKPFLGICIGMQILARTGMEDGEHEGLGWIPGSVVRLPQPPGLRVPHIGWNNVRIAPGARLFAGLSDSPDFYFVHSYALARSPENEPFIAAWCDYGTEFPAAIERDNVFAVQFHPEKSQKSGIRVLRNFLEI